MILKINRGLTSLLLIGVTSLPLILMAKWQIQNVALPGTDAANYLTKAFEIRNILFNGDLPEYIKSLYYVREWKPTSYSAFLSFILLLPYDIHTLIVILSCAIYAFLQVTVFLLVSIFLKKRDSIIIATLSVLFPYVFNWATTLYAETLSSAFILLFIWCYIKSDNFSKSNYVTFGAIFAGIAITIRPGELVILLFLFLALAGYKYLRTTRFGLSNYVLLLFVAVLASTLLFAEFNTPILLSLLGFLIIIFLNNFFNLFNIDNFIQLLLIITVVNLIWYGPFADSLIFWIYETSFGELAQNWDPGISNPMYIFSLITNVLKPLFLPISALILIKIFNWNFLGRIKTKKSLESYKTLITSCFIFFIVPIILLFITNTSDLRRFHAGVLILISLVLIYMWKESHIFFQSPPFDKFFLKIWTPMLFIFIILYVFFLKLLIQDHPLPNKMKSYEIQLIEYLIELEIPKGATSGVYLISDRVINVHRLNLISRYLDSTYLFTYYWKYSSLDENIVKLQENQASYLIIQKNVKNPVIPEWDLYSKLSYRFIRDLNSKEKGSNRLELVAEMIIAEEKLELYRIN